MAVFSQSEANKFAALLAGFDVQNESEAEAISKGRMLRRMAIEKNIRLVDAWELPEIREAIDEQLQPLRAEEEFAENDEEAPDNAMSIERVLWALIGGGYSFFKLVAVIAVIAASLVAGVVGGMIAGIWELGRDIWNGKTR